MDYSRDLLKEKKKSKFALILGILSFVFAIFWIIIKLNDKNVLSTFDWIYSFLFLLNGISHTSSGLGYSIERLIGKAFIKIDNQVIKIKTGAFDKEQSIDWSEISSIDYKPNNFMITKKDSSIFKLSMTKLEYSVIQEIKNVIDKIGNDKNILINLN
ncbi:MAG: hypothetical protein KFF49_07405 [Bacteroidales bacterium]|nr:hypothetical protein [Bacteroidales bacterium]